MADHYVSDISDGEIVDKKDDLSEISDEEDSYFENLKKLKLELELENRFFGNFGSFFIVSILKNNFSP